MTTITNDINTTREALRGLVVSGCDPVVIGFGKGFIGNAATGFTFDPAGADRYESREAADSAALGLRESYTVGVNCRSPFRVIPLKMALSHRLLELHEAMELFQ